MASNIPDDGKTCTICFETYSKPKCLNCGHTFCESCIHMYVMKSKHKGNLLNGIECPLCRDVTVDKLDRYQPDTWAKSLPSNFALEAILCTNVNTEIPKISTDDGTDKEFPFACQTCLDEGNHIPALVFCIDCDKYQCDKCANLHNRFDSTKSHDFWGVGEEEEKLHFLSFVKRLQTCDKHRDTRQYFCPLHSQLCCSKCVIEKHKVCETIKIEDAAMTNSLEKMKKNMKELHTKVTTAVKFWSFRNEDIKKQAKALQVEIRERREKVMKMFDALEQHTMSFLKIKNEERIPDFTNNHEICEKLAADIDKTLTLCESATKYGTSQQKFVVCRYLKDNITRYNASSETEFGKLKVTKFKIDYLSIGDETRNRGEQLGCPVFFSEEIDIDDVQDCMDSSLKLKCHAKQISGSWYRSIDFLTDGRLVVVDHFNSKLLLFDKELNCIGEQYLSFIPFSVKTLGRSKVILVTSGEVRKLFYFEVKTDNTLNEVRSSLIKSCCDTIAPIDNKSFFAGLFGGVNPLGLVTISGDEKFVTVDLPEKRYTAENIKCAYDKITSRLAVSDKNSDKVYVLDMEKDTIITIESESIMQPRGVVFGPNNTLFICSGGTDSIVHATTDGKVLNTRKLNISHPYAICISQERTQLAVANLEQDDKQLQVFDLI